MNIRSRIAGDAVRLSMWLDAACELAGAIVLLLLAGAIANSTTIAREAAIVASGVFLAAAIVVGVMAAGGRRSSARLLAGANIAGGALLWAVLAARWGEWDAGARWLLAAMSDSFLLIGALELVALRRTRTG